MVRETWKNTNCEYCGAEKTKMGLCKNCDQGFVTPTYPADFDFEGAILQRQEEEDLF
jgi:hypothetical protein